MIKALAISGLSIPLLSTVQIASSRSNNKRRKCPRQPEMTCGDSDHGHAFFAGAATNLTSVKKFDADFMPAARRVLGEPLAYCLLIGRHYKFGHFFWRFHNMKTASLIALGLLGSTLGFAAQPSCPNLNLEGTWENGWGIRFKIEQAGCTKLTIHDLNAKKEYHVELDGKSMLVVAGERLENAPAIVKYSYASGGWDKRTITPLVKVASVVGSMIPNRYAGNSNYPQSKDVAEMTLTARIDIPKDKLGKSFYPITASVKATVGVYGVGENEDLYISIDSPKVIAVGDYEPGVFAKGFMKGINALLSLQSFANYTNDGGTYLTGASVFRSVIDSGSRNLKRVH